MNAINMDDTKGQLLRKILLGMSDNQAISDEALRKLCKNPKIVLNKVEVEQVSPVIVKTYSQARVANEVNEPGPSSGTVHSSNKRKRESSERDQERDMKFNKQQRLLDDLSKLLLEDKPVTQDTTPVQGYVSKDKYIRLMNKYNDLQADYAALQERFKLTLQYLDSSETESDLNGEPLDEESDKSSSGHYISEAQWKALSESSTSARNFIQNALQLMFDKETLLTSTVSGKPSNRSIYTYPLLPEPKMLDKDKIELIRVLFNRYLDEKKFGVEDKAEQKAGLMKQIALYIASVKAKHNKVEINGSFL